MTRIFFQPEIMCVDEAVLDVAIGLARVVEIAADIPVCLSIHDVKVFVFMKVFPGAQVFLLLLFLILVLLVTIFGFLLSFCSFIFKGLAERIIQGFLGLASVPHLSVGRLAKK